MQVLPPTEVPFELHYEGEQEKKGEISARALSAGLSGLVDVVDRAAAAGIFGHERKPQVAIKAHAEGSFEVLAALQWAVVHGLEIGAATTGLSVLITSIGKMVDRFKQAKPVDVSPGTSQDSVLIKWSDDEVTEVTTAQWKFMNDPRARRGAKKMIAPMGSSPESGPTRVRMVSDGKEITFDAEDVAHLDDDTAEESQTLKTYVTNVAPAVVDFDLTDPWAVYEDGRKRKVSIEDRAFLSSIDTGEIKIGKTDTLKVRMRLELSEAGDKVSESRYIEEVLKHDPGATQPLLPEEGEE